MANRKVWFLVGALACLLISVKLFTWSTQKIMADTGKAVAEDVIDHAASHISSNIGVEAAKQLDAFADSSVTWGQLKAHWLKQDTLEVR